MIFYSKHVLKLAPVRRRPKRIAKKLESRMRLKTFADFDFFSCLKFLHNDDLMKGVLVEIPLDTQTALGNDVNFTVASLESRSSAIH